ncbi:MAG: ECF-type sigma factor [Pirellulales bacterium]
MRDADNAAAMKIWNHFVSRLYSQARKKLRPETRRVYDEEDAAQSAFHSVCSGIVAGRFPELQDREGLLRLLLAITARKVARRHQHDRRLLRDVNRNLAGVMLAKSSEHSAAGGMEQIRSREPTPEFAAEFAETFDDLFSALDDPSLQNVVTLRFEGYTDSEIAKRLDYSRRTVQRKLVIIRRHWKRLELSHE